MKRKFLAGALLAAAGAAAAETNEDPDMSAVLRGSYFSSSRTLDDRSGYVGLTGELKLNWSFGDNDRLDFHGRTGVYGAGRDDETRDSEVINGSWLHRGEKVDTRIGRQRVTWGRADGVNPTDFFTPYDYTLYLPLEEDQRLSVTAARADVALSENGVLSLVLQPGFRPSILPESSESTLPVRDRRPSNNWNHAQAGARYTQTGENLDWSIAAFRGYHTLPLLSFDGMNANGPVFERFYPRIWGLGVDVARNFGRYGFRGELAYVSPDPEDGRQGIRPYYFLVSGVDRSIDDWNFNVQAVVRHAPDFVDPANAPNAAARVAATQNAILFGQTQATEYGMTARIVANWRHETLQTELLGFANFSTDGYFLRPLATYAIDDHNKVLFGAEYYAGPDESFFGQLKKNRTWFLEYRYYVD